MFLAVRDVLVEARTLEVVSLEELREDARVRVDCVYYFIYKPYHYVYAFISRRS